MSTYLTNHLYQSWAVSPPSCPSPLCSFPSLPIWMQSQFVAISRWFLYAFSASQKSLSHLCMMKFTRLLQFWFPITSVTFCGVHPTQCSCSFCTFMPVILNKCIAMFLFIFLHWGGDCFQFTIYCLHYHLLLNDISNGDKCICFALLVSPKRLGSVKLVSHIYIYLFIYLTWHLTLVCKTNVWTSGCQHNGDNQTSAT